MIPETITVLSLFDRLFSLWLICVSHIGILWLGGLFGVLISLYPGLDLCALFCGRFLLLPENNLAFFFDLVQVALHDRACNSTKLFNLTDIDGLGGIFSIVVEPVLIYSQFGR